MVQMAAVLVLEPIFEADLEPEQHAYRSKRSALDAVRQVERLLRTGHTAVVDADLSGYFSVSLFRCFGGLENRIRTELIGIQGLNLRKFASLPPRSKS
jgi:hypothetical protein